MSSLFDTLISEPKVQIKIYNPHDQRGTHILMHVPEGYMTPQDEEALLAEISILRQSKEIENELYLLEKRKIELMKKQNKLTGKQFKQEIKTNDSTHD